MAKAPGPRSRSCAPWSSATSTRPMAERVLRGRPASPGLAVGPLVRLPKVTVDYIRPRIEQRGDTLLIREEVEPTVEGDRLEAALERARQELAALTAGADEMGAEILEFQLALL